ncbi:MAG: ubiquinol-cytochrome c reductase iron-sulfur subunit [Gammaproteobacteria bacterium]|nr:ubiquinol-cytochrome c reductase iron-sulfur subunit [Gammaproteobacteria bacterium]
MTDDVRDPDNPDRREFLNTVTGVVAGAGVCAAAWPFISSMNPSSDVLSKATTEASLKGLAPGQSKTVSWQGKPVFILHRTDEQIESMAKSDGGKEPQADSERVQKQDWLVVIGICTHLGCVPNRKDAGWFCPCHGSVYDNSGRILHGPAPRNLAVPPYEFLSDNKILIGKSSA